MRIPLYIAVIISLAVGGCGSFHSEKKPPLCPNDQTLRVGVDQQLFSSQQTPNQQEQENKKLETFLQKTTHCLVQIEPIVNATQGTQSLQNGTLDFVFSAPSLAVLALAQESQYALLRSLGQDMTTRSALLVREESDIRSYAGLNKKRIGLLPGDFNGYFLPRYNLYGSRLIYVYQGISYDDLVEKLNKKSVDAIAWNTAIKPLPAKTRIAAIDSHLLPAGALLMHSRLNSLDYTGLLKDLDDYSSQLPSFLGYRAGMRPDLSSYRDFIKIVQTVEKSDKDQSTTAPPTQEIQPRR